MIEIITMKNISSSEKMILLFLLVSGSGDYTFEDFMDGTDMSRSTVARCLSSLYEKGFISKLTTKSSHGYDIIRYELHKESLIPPCDHEVRPCYVYVQKLRGPGLTIGKVGIAFDVEQRMKKQSKKSLFRHELLYSKLYSCYAHASSVEQRVIRNLEKFQCQREWLPDGFTETIHEKDIDKAIKIIGEIK